MKFTVEIAAIVSFGSFVLALILLTLLPDTVFAAPEPPAGRWWENVNPQERMGIAGIAIIGIAALIVFLTVLKPKMPVTGESDFTLERYEEDLKDKIATLKLDLQLISRVDSPEYRKVSAALKEAEQRLHFVESGYKKAVEDITNLAGQLEILRGWVSETEIEAAETMLIAGRTGEAREIWSRIAEDSGVKKSAYARREADAYYHLGLLAKNDLDYKEAMNSFIKGIETGKAGITHLYEAGKIALITRDYRQAEGLFKEALSMACGTDECSRSIVGKCQVGLGDVYMKSGKYNEALPLFNAALVTFLGIYGEDAAPTADTYARIAEVYEKQGQHAEAVELCKKALDIYSEVLPDEHPKVTAVRKRCRVVLT